MLFLSRQRPSAGGLAWNIFLTLCFYCIFLISPQCGSVPSFRLRERIYGTGVRHTRRNFFGRQHGFFDNRPRNQLRGVATCRSGASARAAPDRWRPLKVPDPRTVHPLSPCERQVFLARQRPGAPGSRLSWNRLSVPCSNPAPVVRPAVFCWSDRRRVRLGSLPGSAGRGVRHAVFCLAPRDRDARNRIRGSSGQRGRRRRRW